MIFDAGVFIALDNPSKRSVVLAILRKMLADGIAPTTNEPALAQAWRDPATQVPMTRLVAATTVFPFGDPRVIGVRCAQSGTSDEIGRAHV